jgi:multisubunit Na+/H+ antiporter MnhC subunit
MPPAGVTGGGPVDSTETLATQVYKQTFAFGRFGYGAALALILTALIAMLGLAQLMLLRTGEARISAQGSGFLPYLAVYTGLALSNLAPVPGVQLSTNTLQRFRFAAVQDTMYQIAVDSAPGIGGQIDINAAMTQPTFLGGMVAADGKFNFSVAGPAGAAYRIESSVDLLTWSLVLTDVVPASGVISFSSAFSARSYSSTLALGTSGWS